MSKLLKALITLTILGFSSGSAVAESLIHRPLVDAKARFELTQASGKLLRFEDLKGQLSLVYFGYTLDSHFKCTTGFDYLLNEGLFRRSVAEALSRR